MDAFFSTHLLLLLKERELKIHVKPSVGRRGEDLDKERSDNKRSPEILEVRQPG
jgi:hypothetical protein